MPTIIGYRDLTKFEIELINAIKQTGISLDNLIKELRANPDFDQRWVSIGTTDIQTGLMALVRAIARPESF